MTLWDRLNKIYQELRVEIREKTFKQQEKLCPKIINKNETASPIVKQIKYKCFVCNSISHFPNKTSNLEFTTACHCRLDITKSHVLELLEENQND